MTIPNSISVKHKPFKTQYTEHIKGTHTITNKIKLCRTYIQHSTHLYQRLNKPRNFTYTTKIPQTKHN